MASTRSAIALTLSAGPTRRALLGTSTGALAAAVAASAAGASTVDQDAELLALRPAWESTWATLRFALAKFNEAEIEGDWHRTKRAGEVVSAATDANSAATDQIAATAARTLAGVRFKVEASIAEDHTHEDLMRSIMDDIAAMPIAT